MYHSALQFVARTMRGASRLVSGAAWRLHQSRHTQMALTTANVQLRATAWIHVAAAPADGDANRFIARVWLYGQPAWRFEFRPRDWRPTPGVMSAELVYLDNIPWPVLAQTRDGVIVPHARPEAFDNRAEGRARVPTHAS
jgi:hypothetical protein